MRRICENLDMRGLVLGRRSMALVPRLQQGSGCLPPTPFLLVIRLLEGSFGVIYEQDCRAFT